MRILVFWWKQFPLQELACQHEGGGDSLWVVDGHRVAKESSFGFRAVPVFHFNGKRVFLDVPLEPQRCTFLGGVMWVVLL